MAQTLVLRNEYRYLLIVLICVRFHIFLKEQKFDTSKNVSTHDTYKIQNLGKHLSTVYVIHAPSNLLICEPSHAEKAWENILSFNPFHAKNLF